MPSAETLDTAPPSPRLRGQAERLALHLPALLVEAERVAHAVAQGVHGRKRAGVGETFWQFRGYEPGDDARDVDWWQWASLRQLYIREQEWEAAQGVWLWCDLSASMAWAGDRRLPQKRERAIVLTLALAALLVRAGERVALLGAGGAPRGGRFGLERLVAELPAAAARAETLPPAPPLPRHGTVVLLSDFLEPIDAIGRRLDLLAATGVTGCLLQVNDPKEEELPFEGRVVFEGVAGEERLLVRQVGRVRADYQARFKAQRLGLGRAAGRLRGRFASHRTDRPASAGLLTLYQMLAPSAVR